MAKKRKEAKKPVETRKRRALRKKEQHQQRMVLIGLGIVGLIVVGLLAMGLYQEYVAKPASPVAIVGDVPIRTDAYQKRVRLERFNLRRSIEYWERQKAMLDPEKEEDKFYIQLVDQQLQQLKSRLENVGVTVLQQMIDEELIRQKAAEEGITVTPQEVQLQIERAFGYERNPPTPTPTPITATLTITGTPTPTPTRMTEKEFKQAYKEFITSLQKQVGISEQEYRDIVAVILLREKLRQVLADKVPTTAEQVHVRHILLDSEEEAKEVLEKLKAGADFAELAKEYSKDEATKDNGGDLGWFPRGKWEKTFEDVAFSLEVGRISGIIKTSMGYHIIKVEGHEMNRELDPAYLAERRASALEDWLAKARNSDKVKRFWTPDKVPPEETPQVK